MSLNRRRFGTALAAGLLGSRAARAQQPPNVLVILTSELRADALSCMGAPLARTFAIDDLAKQGCLLRQAISPVPESGGRGAMAALTGRYPKARSVGATVAQSYSGIATLPELLAHGGYQTAVIGHPPAALAGVGADLVKLFPEPDYQDFLTDSYPSFVEDYARMSEPAGIPPEGRPPWSIGTAALPPEGFPTRWIANQTLEFLQSQKDAGPWCCVTAFSKPREPYIVPEPWASRYQLDKIPMPALPAIRPLPETTTNQARDYAVASQNQIIRRLLRAYFGAVSFVDDEVGLIVRELRILKQFDNTIIAIVGETGHMLGEHGRMFGAVPYEGAVRVPCILRFPAGVKAGGRIEAPVSTTAIVPTLLDLAGAKRDEPFDAPSLASMLKEPAPGADGEAFCAMGFEAIQTPEWKLVEKGDHPTWEPQLFDLRADPGESRNLYGEAEGAKARSELGARLEEWRKRLS